MRLIFSSRFSTHPECRHQVFRANAATVRHGGRWRMSAGGASSLRLTIAHGQWWATVGNGQEGTGFAPSRARGRLFRAAFGLAIHASRRNAPPKPRRLRSRLSASDWSVFVPRACRGVLVRPDRVQGVNNSVVSVRSHRAPPFRVVPGTASGSANGQLPKDEHAPHKPLPCAMPQGGFVKSTGAGSVAIQPLPLRAFGFR